MKVKIKYLILTSVFMLSWSCDYLDIVPDKQETIEKAFTELRNAQRYLATCYHYLPSFESDAGNPGRDYGGEVISLEFWQESQANMLTRLGNNISAPRINYWDGAQGGNNHWHAIRHCNVFLENIWDVPDMRRDQKEIWAAEVTFLKAFYHWWLVQMYGPVPLMRTNMPVSATTDQVQVFRDPVDDCIDYIVELLDEAIEFLPLSLESPLTELGRITKPIALAFKAKVLVHAASPFFNGNTLYAGFKDSRNVQLFSQTYDPRKWEKARDACREAIEVCETMGHSLYYFAGFSGTPINDNTRLALVPSQIITTTSVSDLNNEAIWVAFANVSDLQLRHMPFTNRGLSLRRLRSGPTLATAERFYSSNGVPIEEDKEWEAKGWYRNRYAIADEGETDGHEFLIANTNDFRTANLHYRREPRFYGSIAFDGSRWYGGLQATPSEATMSTIDAKAGRTSGKQSVSMYSPTGMFVRKLVSYETYDANVTAANPIFVAAQYRYPVIRLADLYLLYAEALNEADGPQGDPNGITDLDSPYTWLNLIRDRAEIGRVGDSWDNYTNNKKYTSKEGLRDIIHQERLNELAFEGHYWFDIRRWSSAVDARYDIMNIMNNPIYGWNVDAAGDDFYTPTVVFFPPAYSVRDHLWPIRESNIVERNPRLVQNPGW